MDQKRNCLTIASKWHAFLVEISDGQAVNGNSDIMRKRYGEEEGHREQVIFARFINDANHTHLLRFRVR